jgi:hypothetical protein
MREDMTLEQARRTLGLSAHANAVDIRRAFKRLALEHHPDRNPGDARAAARFRKICLAHEILLGNREPAPDSFPVEAPPGATAQSYRWSTRAPWDPPEPPRPEVALDGRPLHYPTPEEIAALEVPPAVSGDSMARWGLGGLAVFVLVIWLLTLVSREKPDVGAERPDWGHHGQLRGAIGR